MHWKFGAIISHVVLSESNSGPTVWSAKVVDGPFKGGKLVTTSRVIGKQMEKLQNTNEGFAVEALLNLAGDTGFIRTLERCNNK